MNKDDRPIAKKDFDESLEKMEQRIAGNMDTMEHRLQGNMDKMQRSLVEGMSQVTSSIITHVDQQIEEVRDDIRRLESKVDTVTDDHSVRIAKLEKSPV